MPLPFVLRRDSSTLSGKRESDAPPAAPEPNDLAAAFRALPAVSALLADAEIRAASMLDERTLTRLVRDALDDERARIRDGAGPTAEAVRQRVLVAVRSAAQPRLTPAINATGVIVHTNLGRAPVSPETAAAMAAAASSYVPLEIESETNQRGGRMREISLLMRLLTGAEATLVVNNNAAAVLLVFSALAAGRQVVLSRGEAVEIGGGFRVSDVLRQSGAALVEVGTTNRTYARDYSAAIDNQTALLLKVHPSNFTITGFTAAASVAELVEVARPHDLPVVEDLGSGALLDTAQFALGPEPTIEASLKAGAAVVTASGDKLIGGPQAGVIAGGRRWIEQIAKHPLARAVRADKTCLAGVATTLRHYACGEAVARIPIWRMIAARPDELRARGERLAAELARAGVQAEVTPTRATVGGGSLPGQTLPSIAMAFDSVATRDDGLDGLARRLRLGAPRVFGRIEDGRLLLDLRTVLPEDDDRLRDAIAAAAAPPE